MDLRESPPLRGNEQGEGGLDSPQPNQGSRGTREVRHFRPILHGAGDLSPFRVLGAHFVDHETPRIVSKGAQSAPSVKIFCL